MMKTRKKLNTDGREAEEEDSDFHNSDSEENPMEEDEGLQDVLDEIKNEKSDKEMLIDLVKKALFDTDLFVNCSCARANGFAIG